MTSRAWPLAALLLLLACEKAEGPGIDADSSLPNGDRDGDWACDDSERLIGSDPENHDSDGDRLPDGLELHYGFNPLDAADPGIGRVVFLEGTPSSISEVELHVVVDGAGEAFSGELGPLQVLDVTWPRAERYFESAIAISAEPPDHVFGFPDNGDRIESVVGETRLGFRLRFTFVGSDNAPCAQAVPFVYAIKRQDGARFGDQLYALVIAPDLDDITWCPARACL